MRHDQRRLGRYRLADPSVRARYVGQWLRSLVWVGLALGGGYLLGRFVNSIVGAVVALLLIVPALRARWNASLILFPQWRGQHRNRQHRSRQK